MMIPVASNTYVGKLLVLDRNTWNHITMCKQFLFIKRNNWKPHRGKWRNNNHLKKWTWQAEFSFWMKLVVSLHANVFEKGMNPSFPPPVMSKYLDRLGSLAMVLQLVYEKENSEFKPALLPWKIDLVLHLVCSGREILYFGLVRNLIWHLISPNQDDLSYSAWTFSGQQIG